MTKEFDVNFEMKKANAVASGDWSEYCRLVGADDVDPDDKMDNPDEVIGELCAAGNWTAGFGLWHLLRRLRSHK